MKRTKTTAQHKRDGTYQHSRHGGAEAKFPMGDPKPPAELNTAAKAEWKRLFPELVELGMFTIADRGTFSVYCQSFADYHAYTSALNKKKSHTQLNGVGVPQPVPEVAMRRQAWSMMKESGSRFGLDPVARIGLAVSPKPKEDEDEAFLFGPKVVE